ISGFLIAGILSRNPSLSDFYSRRFIRIVPPYAGMILAALSCAALIFAPTDFDEVAVSTKWCLFFARNLQQVSEAKDYWAQASEYSLLLHTWSLGVEIQFYLVAPLLHFSISSMPGSWTKTLVILILLAASLGLHSTSDATNQFYSLPCRIWQFLLGFLAA
ncbi:hypothetical protein PENTCL1PPCAC_5977, partial [Pristionchus entomophagus]